MGLFWFRSLLILVPVAAANAYGTDPKETPTPLAAQMAYYMEHGGHWRAENPEHEPGDGKPAWFEYQFEWSLPNHLAVVRISGAMENGEDILYWNVFSAWHPEKEKVVLYQFGSRGHLSHGEVNREGDHLSHVFAGWNPNGQSYQFRDREIRLGPDKFRSETLISKNGIWQVAQSLTWHRVKTR